MEKHNEAYTNQAFPASDVPAPPMYNTQPQGISTQPQGFTTQPQQIYSIQPGVINTHSTVPVVPRFGRTAQGHKCQHCQANVVTEVHYDCGGGSWLIGLGLLLLTGVFCCIPCFFDGLKDAVHMCPNCKREVGQKTILS